MINDRKSIWILIGPNGAGKSTFAASPPDDLSGLSSVPYLNPDPILQRNLQRYSESHWQKALRQTSIEMDNFIQDHLYAGRSFMVEKVAPTLGFIGAQFSDLQDEGWNINTIAIGLHNGEVSAERVAKRVAKGGHDVLVSDFNKAFSIHLGLMPELIGLSDFARIYDNSNKEFELIAEKIGRNRPLSIENAVTCENLDGTYFDQIIRD